MSSHSKINLVLFFSRNMSLKLWDSIGMFEREVALYRRLQKLGIHISFVTYGDSSELGFADRLPGIDILCNRWKMPAERYERWLIWQHAPSFIKSHIIKTNQINGADIALQVARFWRKPLIARGGYLFFPNMENEFGLQSTQAKLAEKVESLVMPSAQCIVVTTDFMKEYICNRYNILPNKVVVIPNYVDTDIFIPNPLILRKPRSLCFVGRLEEGKNPIKILKAIVDLDVHLTVVGNGSLETDMRAIVNNHHMIVEFMGNLPHYMLSDIYNQSEIYVQPSSYEGHPKTIIEAMSCGSAVIGGNTIGTNNVIQHGNSGWLCDPTVDGIRNAIISLLSDESLRRRLGQNAREFVLQNYALDKIVKKELSLYHDLLSHSYVHN